MISCFNTMWGIGQHLSWNDQGLIPRTAAKYRANIGQTSWIITKNVDQLLRELCRKLELRTLLQNILKLKPLDYAMSSSSDSISIPTTSLWANRKCLLAACIVATANMQYGFDSAAVGALQAIPGFLRIFGYPDPSSPLGYGIDVSID
jgi:hypothetical protein